MRNSLFAIVLLIAAVLGGAALFEHRPGPGRVAVEEPAAAGRTPVPATGDAAPTGKPDATASTAPVARPAPPGAATEHTGTPPAASAARTTTVAMDMPSGAPAGHAVAPMAGMQHAAAHDTGPAGDPAAGLQVFRKCAACHSLTPGKNLVGPSLGGVIGRKAGTEPGFMYSAAMKDAKITWTPDTLSTYLAEPQKAVPGNRMPFPGLKSQHDRDDVIAYLVQAAGGAPSASQAAPAIAAAPSAAPPPVTHGMPDMPDVNYTLRTGIAEGRMVFIGVGGAVDGQVDPVLTAAEGQTVQVTLINGEGAEHDVVFPDQHTQSPRVTGKGASTTIAFRAEAAGDFIYYCNVPGHRAAGMEGKFLVTPRPATETVAYADISREPTDLPGPIGRREPQTVRVDLVAVEVEGRLAQGTTFGFWTFNGKVPGPFLRVRVGDRVEVHLKNSADSSMIHSVDFHAATGPGGGASVLQVNPGDEKVMTFKALVPGLFVYHCATPMVAEHIANGMYGMILVEPEEGLTKVDHEFLPDAG